MQKSGAELRPSSTGREARLRYAVTSPLILRITAGGALLCVTESGSPVSNAERQIKIILNYFFLLHFGAKTVVFDPLCGRGWRPTRRSRPVQLGLLYHFQGERYFGSTKESS